MLSRKLIEKEQSDGSLVEQRWIYTELRRKTFGEDSDG